MNKVEQFEALYNHARTAKERADRYPSYDRSRMADLAGWAAVQARDELRKFEKEHGLTETPLEPLSG